MAPKSESPTPADEKKTRREGVTLTTFQWWQIDQLVGIYAPTVPEVLKRAVLEWLQEHHDEIGQQKADYAKFQDRSKG